MWETYCSRLLNAILANGVSDDDSYSIVECSRVRRSNALSEPSAPTETKISAERGSHDLNGSVCVLPFYPHSALVIAQDRVHSQVIHRLVMCDELC